MNAFIEVNVFIVLLELYKYSNVVFQSDLRNNFLVVFKWEFQNHFDVPVNFCCLFYSDFNKVLHASDLDNCNGSS